MKELSIEEKAKRYDEAIKKAKVFKEHLLEINDKGYADEMDYIFPELKESEDEKVRKALLELVHDTTGDELWVDYNVHKEDALAWLEKQGSNKKEWLFEKGKWYVKLQHHYEGDLRHFEKGHAYQALSEVKITDGYHNVSLGSWEIPEYFRPATKDEISKETEQTSKLDENEEIRNYFINAVNEQADIYPEWKEKCLAWLEKQGEQPSAIRWYDVSLIPQEMEELLVEWDSEDATWHEIAFYHADTKTFWNGTRQVENVTRWCYIIDLLEKQGDKGKLTHEDICKAYNIPDIGEFSDGYHTFNGLYKQRMILFAVLVKTYKDKAWKSWKHEDGLDCFGGGWFIVGIDTPAGTYTYHYEAKDWDRFDCQILDKAKHWDGHDEFDVERLFSLVSNDNKIEVFEKQGEQKPAETVKWSPQEESCICQLESLVKEQWRQAEGVRNSVNIKKMSELMFFLKTLNPNKKPQRMVSAEAKEAMYNKPACVWSEEDETRLQVCIDCLQAKSLMGKVDTVMTNWLKSLKQRIGG